MLSIERDNMHLEVKATVKTSLISVKFKSEVLGFYFYFLFFTFGNACP